MKDLKEVIKTLYTIGAMGHANQIGLSISNKENKKEHLF